MNVLEVIRPNEQIIARDEVHNSQKNGCGHITSQAADDALIEIDHKRIAEALRHEGDPFIVRRYVRTFAEMGQDFDVGWKVIEWVARLSLGEQRKGADKSCDC